MHSFAPAFTCVFSAEGFFRARRCYSTRCLESRGAAVDECKIVQGFCLCLEWHAVISILLPFLLNRGENSRRPADIVNYLLQLIVSLWISALFRAPPSNWPYLSTHWNWFAFNSQPKKWRVNDSWMCIADLGLCRDISIRMNSLCYHL
jgi:hypothetical protein